MDHKCTDETIMMAYRSSMREKKIMSLCVGWVISGVGDRITSSNVFCPFQLFLKYSPMGLFVIGRLCKGLCEKNSRKKVHFFTKPRTVGGRNRLHRILLLKSKELYLSRMSTGSGPQKGPKWQRAVAEIVALSWEPFPKRTWEPPADP